MAVHLALTISRVIPVWAALAAFAVGLVVGVLLVWAVRRAPRADLAPTFDVAEPVVPAGVADILAVLSSSGVVVGPHDEVLQATSTARTLGLVRGTRIAVPELLQLVRMVRRQVQVRIHLQISRGAAPVGYLIAQVAPLVDP